MKRLEYLDQMKGVAIFLMVMGHVLLFTFDMAECTLSNVFFINMPIFFYVSGYLLYKSINTRQELFARLRHKAMRLLPPWIAVTVVMAWVQKWNVFSTLCNFYWFFYVLFLLTMIVVLVDFLVFRHIVRPVLYIASLLVITVAFAGLKFIGLYNCYLPAHYLCMYSVPFLLGWVCRKYDRINTFMVENQWLYIVCIAMFLFCWYKLSELNNYVHLLGALCGIVVLQSALYHNEQKCNKMPIVSMVGRSTLAIYALNNFLLPDLTGLVDGAGKTFFAEYGLLVQFVIIGIVTAVVIAGCMCVEWLFHNNKYLSKIL